VNKSFVKFLTDFGPLLIFFVVYYKSGNNLIVAIPPLIVATIIAIIIVYILEKRIPYIPLLGGLLISFLEV
jgi:intracellular septation protein